MEELKPCPFCGGEAKVMRDKYSGVYFVGCSNDMCLGFSALGWTYETTGEAIAAWNQRAERTCDDIGNDSFVCSKCGFDCHVTSKQDGLSIPDYCPSCGAKVVI